MLKCRPPGNRDPHPAEIEACQDYLLRQVELIEPRVICTLGNFATKLLRGDPTGITRLHGRAEVRVIGRRAVRLYPIFHPAAALYTPANVEVLRADFARLPELLALDLPPQPEPALEEPAVPDAGEDEPRARDARGGGGAPAEDERHRPSPPRGRGREPDAEPDRKPTIASSSPPAVQLGLFDGRRPRRRGPRLLALGRRLRPRPPRLPARRRGLARRAARPPGRGGPSSTSRPARASSPARSRRPAPRSSRSSPSPRCGRGSATRRPARSTGRPRRSRFPDAERGRRHGRPGVPLVRRSARRWRRSIGSCGRGGALALVWNRRPLEDPVHAAIERIIAPYRGDAPAHRSGAWRAAFDATTLFGPLEERTFAHSRPHDADALATASARRASSRRSTTARKRTSSPLSAASRPKGRRTALRLRGARVRPPAVTTRVARLSDAETIARTMHLGIETYTAFAPAGWTPRRPPHLVENLAEHLRSRHTWGLLADVEGQPAGHARCSRTGSRRRRLPLAPVHPPGVVGYRPRRRAPRRVPRGGARPGYRTARLHTPAGHARARRFYERRGWRVSAPPETWLDLAVIEYRCPIRS